MFSRIGMVKERGNSAFKNNLGICILVSFVVFVLTTTVDSLCVQFIPDYSARYEAMRKWSFYKQVYQYAKTTSFIDLMMKAIRYVMPIIMVAALTFCLQILFTNPFTVSYTRFFMENSVTKTDGVKMLFVFKTGCYPTVAWKMFLKQLYIMGWSLLFVVPGIMKSYSYRLVPHILAENPDLDRKRVFEISEQMMKGHRWESFLLELSFIGWVFIGVVTYGIGNIVYTNPYMQTTFAEYYFNLKEEAFKNKVFHEKELPVFKVEKGKVKMV